MTTQQPIPFVGQAYESRSLDLNAQRCVNLYLEAGGPEGKTPAALFGTPGLTRLFEASVGAVEIRGMWAWRGFLWVVAGSSLYRVNSAFEAGVVGSIGTSRGPVSLTNNPNQLAIVDGARMYYFDFPSQTFGVVTDTEVPSGARQISYLAGSFLVEDPNTNVFVWSAINDVQNWNGTDFATAEGTANPIIAHAVLFGEFYAIKTTTTEVFQADSKGFTKSGNASIQMGCAAAFSVAQMDNGLVWLGRDDSGQGIIVTVRGYQAQRISNHGIETAIARMSRIDDARAYVYQQEGHTFYVINFPAANETWCYDAATQSWHERASLNSTTGETYRHRSNCYATFAGKNIVGDFENGRLYELDLYNYTDDGENILRLRSSPTLAVNQRPVSYGSLQVDLEGGVGLNDGLGSLPMMMCRFSDDGGHTWSNRRQTSMGKIGAYGWRAKWNRLGRGRNRVWEVSVTDKVKTVILGAYAEFLA